MIDKIGRGGLTSMTNNRRHERMELPKNTRATLRGSDGTMHDVDVQDISSGGAGLVVDGTFENASFVELHMEGLGTIKAHVARGFADGIGVAFDLDEQKKKDMEEELKAFRKTVAGGKF
ncbi:MAG: PilZ domain-containing protein [Proteobacteria bacterium]|nr:PilZ domain-containing protein [Pseudomonadota bacterium]